MTRVAYFDCIAGITGDSALGAIIDAGLDPDDLRANLDKLPLEPFELVIEEAEEHGYRCTRTTVRAEPVAGVIRTYSSVRALLEDAVLPEGADALAHRMFRLYADAEAKVHRRDPEAVTFHDADGLKTIVGLVGTALGIAALGIERIFASAVPTGFGMVRTDHGAMPIPTPTVVELLRGAPLFSRGVASELTTAAGAAILAATVEGYGEMPAMRIEDVGYGAGPSRLEIPNLLRVIVGEEEPAASQPSGVGTPGLRLVPPAADDPTDGGA